MKRFIKTVALLLSLILVVGLAACDIKTKTPATPTDITGEETPAIDTLDPAEGEPAKEGYTSLDDFKLFDANGNLILTGRDATGTKGMVSAPKYEAAKIGVEIIEQGGNAFDAAAAVGFALGMVEPDFSGLGGGGFMTIYIGETGETHFVDFREKAGENMTPDIWEMGPDDKVVGNAMYEGGKSTGVPGEVAGLLYLLEEFGSMDREQVIRPAIDLTEAGITVTPTLAASMLDNFDKMQKYPEFGAYYLKDDLVYETGDVFTNPDLAKALEIIIKDGKDGFYKGEIAEAVVAANNKYDGVLTLNDLANYEVHVTQPVSGTYRGYEILSSPPPSSGGAIIIEILNILENFDLSQMEHNSGEELHLWAEAFKMAYADRGEYMGDPNYVQVPLNGLMSKEYAKTLAEKIDLSKSMGEVKADDPWAFEPQDTTHYSIADADGNVVSVTKTINGIFGSGVAVDGYGFILNNEMGDFDFGPDKPNSIAPGKIPLSSMSPTIVLKEGKPFMVLGAPGGTTIISTVAQVISNVIDHDMTMQEAVDAPRIKGYREGKIQYETRIPKESIEVLEGLGHVAEGSDEWNRSFGSIQGVLYEEDGSLSGAADPRRDGKALGY